jgi:hypothetical protein
MLWRMPLITSSPTLRQPCPPGACICARERLDLAEAADRRILGLTRQEEKRLVARLEQCTSLAELQRLQQRMFDQLGLQVHVGPGNSEVKTMRGIRIEVQPLPGLCRKTRQAIPAAIRRALEQTPEIAFALLNAQDLLRDA